ncbi:hypothetical protein NBRC10512_000999 [Rhodotorula toruloides]|uniref:RHTO0S17e02916g1_1 n=2 Tax=Rhodotorula toruloides TaxID=5286 RepID=A0A061BEJ7_RHOTO|nr:protein of caleosin family [Rhodotorula toruloides NP11]EMS20509.1 protein of caleosin family [Rhodotorula toruloides NP11]CDR48407.1 RHTO0S17e02916g1_1 [Rhodotorula toruloides]
MEEIDCEFVHRMPWQQNQDGEETQGAENGEDTAREGDEWAGRGSDLPGAPFKTTLRGHIAMEARPVSEEASKGLAEPYVPRANIAATPERPFGTQEGNWAKQHENDSVLQQHCAFFDPDNDGIVWPWDVFWGFHQLGYALPWCILSVMIISTSFSWFTSESWIPNPLFPINLKHIHRAKHGSDTGTYHNEGRFIPAHFEAIFSKFDKGLKGGVTFYEGLQLIRAQRNILDFAGWVGAFFEMLATYLLIWPADGIMRKEDLRTVYDGSIFYTIAARECERRRLARSESLLFYLFTFFPLNGIFKENRAQTTTEYARGGGKKGRISREQLWNQKAGTGWVEGLKRGR